ncbi:MAG: sulfatase-like hydrolase/transferase [Planctomycetota bacterium]|nr:sulfatase-like hydrolase/transferase [Planctomycetota bacterium]
MLATNQYEFVAFEPYTRLFPEDQGVDVRERIDLLQQLTILKRDLPPALLSKLIPADFPGTLPSPANIWFGVTGRDIPPQKSKGLFRYDPDLDRAEQFEHFLRCIQPREKPTLYFHHIILPHTPWNYLPSGKKFKAELASNESGPAGGQGPVGLDWGPDELVVAQNQQRYYLQFRFVDRLLGQLIERMKDAGIYDSSLLIVTADHGVSFVANHGRRVPTDDSLGDILSIPMFIKAPGQMAGEPDDRNVESIDLLPTILGTLDYQPLAATDGQNVLAPGMKPRPTKLFFQTSDPRVIDADFPEAAEALRRSLRTRNASLDVPLGPAPQLVGRKVSELAEGAESSLKSGWNFEGDEVRDDPSALLPCLVQGRISPIPKPDQPVMLAVAVNGTIVGTTQTYQLELAREHWSLLFHEKYLQVGKNAFVLYELRGDANDRTLHRVPTSRDSSIFLQ